MTPPVCRWDDVANPRGAVHIIHGLAEHPERYERLARALNAARFVVWAHHQRGHGSNPEPGIKGHFADENGWQALVDDAWTVSVQLQEKFPRVPLILFAHSMGSFVGQGVLAAHGEAYTVAVLSGTNGPPALQELLLRNLARVQKLTLGARQPGRWLHRLVFDSYNARYGRGAAPNTWLSRDEDEVRTYNDDPECGFPLTSQAWLDLLNARAAQGTADFYRRLPKSLPVHVLAGTADPVGEYGEGVQRLLKALATAGLTRVTLQSYVDARHELVNETNRQEVMRDLIAWLSDSCPHP
jgi:alpha-beta hydrolase superfamily lysophospholipase